jgi:hypothetical protein
VKALEIATIGKMTNSEMEGFLSVLINFVSLILVSLKNFKIIKTYRRRHNYHMAPWLS